MKKILVHGSVESLKEFFSEKLLKPKYNVVGIISDDSQNKVVANIRGGGGLRI